MLKACGEKQNWHTFMQKASDLCMFMSNTGQPGVPAFPQYFHSPTVHEWRMSWLRYIPSCLTLDWNLAPTAGKQQLLPVCIMLSSPMFCLHCWPKTKNEQQRYCKSQFSFSFWDCSSGHKNGRKVIERSKFKHLFSVQQMPQGPRVDTTTINTFFDLFFVASFLIKASVPGQAQQNFFTACSF